MKVVIVGAGPAGVTVAETLRYYDRQVEITMISAEPYPPYAPPAMLEHFTTGREVHFWKGKDFADCLGIDYRLGIAAQAILPQDNTITCSDGQRLDYDVLVLSPGAQLHSPLTGQDKRGIYNLKSLSATHELFERIRRGEARTALIVGAGFIGIEVGVVLADMGLEVTQLVRSRVLRQRVDPQISDVLQGMMKERGVRIINDAEADAEAFVGDDHAEGICAKSGTVHRADIIIAATGLKPNIEFLEGSTVQIERTGIPVNEHLRTNISNIYAAGDVAITPNRITSERLVHGNFPNAVVQGKTVAQNILGWDTPYEGADAMNSLKHFGIKVMAVGEWQEEEMAIAKNGTLRKLYFRDNRIVGFCLVGDVHAAGIYRTLMNRKDDVSEFKDQLLQPGFGTGYISSLVP